MAHKQNPVQQSSVQRNITHNTHYQDLHNRGPDIPASPYPQTADSTVRNENTETGLIGQPISATVDSSTHASNTTYTSVHTSAKSTQPPTRTLWRFGSVAGAFLLLTLIVLSQLFNHVLFGPSKLDRLRQGAFIVGDAVEPRGIIVDRDGEILAADHFSYELSATPNLIDDELRLHIAQELGRLLSLDVQAIWDLLDANKEQAYVRLQDEITMAQGRVLDEYRDLLRKELEGEAVASTDVTTGATVATGNLSQRIANWQHIHITPKPSRYYPQGTLASQVLGLVNTDRQGFYGVEGYYDNFLQRRGVGLTGKVDDDIDSLGMNIRRFVPSPAGKDLVLTIDRTVQWIIEDELKHALARYRAERGSIIVMEPDTGAILGLANWPDYNPNKYSEYSADSLRRFANPSVSEQYEPGSIFKIITMAAGLDTEVITPTTSFVDMGVIFVGGRPIFNSNRSSIGETDVTQALIRSLNVVTAQVAEKTGSEQFYRYVRRFGFGTTTGVDLAGEINGLLKKPGHEDWSVSDLGTNSFGQGLAVTPLQMINATAAIANGGKLMQPHIVDTRIWNEQVKHTEPTVRQPAISPKTSQEMTDMMVSVVKFGNKAARVSGYTIAGKSGTAQIPTETGYAEDETIVSFVGFAPADDPQFVMLIKLERPDPNISPWAAYTAAPTFSLVARRLFDHLNIPPDDIRLGKSEE
ncbi:MAG: penicillin-binding protein 2 [Chloroflexota bacterium]